MFLDYFSLALGNLKHRGARSWLTMLGIFIGIAAVVSLISLGQGLERAITGQFATLSTDTLIVTNAETGFGPPGSTAIKKLTEHDLEVIERVQGVKMTIPRLLRVVKVEYNKIARFDYITSMPKDEEKINFIYNTFNLEPESGKLLTSENKGKVLLGNDFTNSNFFEKKIRVGSTLNIQGKDFEVIGILKKTSSFQFNSIIFMLEEDMEDILNIEDEIDLIVVRVENADRAEEVSENIKRVLRRDRNLKLGEEDFSVQTPISAIQSVRTILNIINLIVSGIAALSLMIGGIGIANTMFTSVLERTREIGIMKSVGAQNKDILLIFLIESGLLGLVGGIIGALIGLGLAFTAALSVNIFFGIKLFTVSLSIPLLFGSILFSCFLGLISGIVPAYQASKLKPVEALRK